jgi:hypothetical protein
MNPMNTSHSFVVSVDKDNISSNTRRKFWTEQEDEAMHAILDTRDTHHCLTGGSVEVSFLLPTLLLH